MIIIEYSNNPFNVSTRIEDKELQNGFKEIEDSVFIELKEKAKLQIRSKKILDSISQIN